MANETTTTTLAKIIAREAYAAGQLYFAERPGIAGLVTKKDISGMPTLTGRFPIYDKVSSASIAENTDFTTNSALSTAGGTIDVVVSEHAIKFLITDLTLDATVEDVLNPAHMVGIRGQAEGAIIGAAVAEALQRNQDQDLATLFSSFTSSTGSNSGKLTQQLLIDSITLLNQNNIPTDPRVTVLHAKQWADLLPTFDDANVYGAQGAAVVASGAVGQLYGSMVFQTNNVQTATVSASTVYAGATMHPSAIALVVKGQMGAIEAERDASLRATELVGTGVWGSGVYRGGATTSGRGGAGVYLYGNSTA